MAENKLRFPHVYTGVILPCCGRSKLGGALPWSAWDNLTKRVFFQQSWQAWLNSKSSKTGCLHCTPQKWVTLIQAIFSHTHRGGVGGLGLSCECFQHIRISDWFFVRSYFVLDCWIKKSISNTYWCLTTSTVNTSSVLKMLHESPSKFRLNESLKVTDCPWNDGISNGDFIIQRSVFAMFQGW